MPRARARSLFVIPCASVISVRPASTSRSVKTSRSYFDLGSITREILLDFGEPVRAGQTICFTLRDMWVKSGSFGLGHVGHGPWFPQSRRNMRPPIRSRLIASSSVISSG